MIRYNWFVRSLFFVTASIALISPAAMMLALWLFLLAMIFVPTTNKLSRHSFSWQLGIKQKIALASLLLFCSLIPQADTNMAVFTSPIEDLKNSWHYS